MCAAHIVRQSLLLRDAGAADGEAHRRGELVL